VTIDRSKAAAVGVSAGEAVDVVRAATVGLEAGASVGVLAGDVQTALVPTPTGAVPLSSVVWTDQEVDRSLLRVGGQPAVELAVADRPEGELRDAIAAVALPPGVGIELVPR
jgi:multidrug efflux pump subunit AcrB